MCVHMRVSLCVCVHMCGQGAFLEGMLLAWAVDGFGTLAL